jgi:hypothetical protein
MKTVGPSPLRLVIVSGAMCFTSCRFLTFLHRVLDVLKTSPLPSRMEQAFRTIYPERDRDACTAATKARGKGSMNQELSLW